MGKGSCVQVLKAVGHISYIFPK